MSLSPALEVLEYTLLPVEESLNGRRRIRGAQKSSRPEPLSLDEVSRALEMSKSCTY
jgi:hypothetical protein